MPAPPAEATDDSAAQPSAPEETPVAVAVADGFLHRGLRVALAPGGADVALLEEILAPPPPTTASSSTASLEAEIDDSAVLSETCALAAARVIRDFAQCGTK